MSMKMDTQNILTSFMTKSVSAATGLSTSREAKGWQKTEGKMKQNEGYKVMIHYDNPKDLIQSKTRGNL